MNDMLSEFRRVEQTLQRLTIIAEQLNEGVALIDLNGIIHFVNPAMVKMHGYLSVKDLINKKINVFHSEDQMNTDVFPMIEEVKLKGQIQRKSEHLRSDGTMFPTQTKMILLKNESDKVDGIIVFITDITQYIQRENLLTKRIFEFNVANRHLQLQIDRHRQAEAFLNERTSELTADNKNLQQQVSERQQAIDQLEQQIIERQQSEQKLQEHCEQLKQRVQESTDELVAVNEQMQELIECNQAKEKLPSSSDGFCETEGLTVGDYYRNLAKMFSEDNINRVKTSSKPSERRMKSKRHEGQFDTEELVDLAEMAKRLSTSSSS